jgi:hypothetical protein
VNELTIAAALALPGSDADPGAVLILGLAAHPTEPPLGFPRPPFAGSNAGGGRVQAGASIFGPTPNSQGKGKDGTASTPSSTLSREREDATQPQER